MNFGAIVLSVIVVAFFVFVASRMAPAGSANAPVGSANAPGGQAAVYTSTTLSDNGSPLALDMPAPVSAPFGSGVMDTVDTSQTDSMQLLGATVLANHLAQRQEDPIELQCTEEEVPCPQEVVWRNSFPGCGSFHIPIEGKSYFKDDRLWQGDLNPKIQERYAVMGKEWDPYQYMNARQAWMQFIATNNSSQSDKYMHAIDDLTDVDTTRVTDIEPVPVF